MQIFLYVTLQSLALLTKQMAIDEQRKNICPLPPPENVYVDTAALTAEGPLPTNKRFALGPARNFREAPRPLDRSEY